MEELASNLKPKTIAMTKVQKHAPGPDIRKNARERTGADRWCFFFVNSILIPEPCHVPNTVLKLAVDSCVCTTHRRASAAPPHPGHETRPKKS